MEFNSLFFMMICLPLFILIMRMTANTKAEPYILLCFSLLFYLLSDIRSFLLLAVFILFTWISAQAVHRHSSLYPLYLLITAGLLSIFKYGSFIISHLGAYLHGASAISLIMPVGISFYIFTGISYVSDVYYGKYPPERDLLYLASYLTFFPTIVSGPLHRYEAYRAYLNTHRINCDSIAYGLRRFILGLGKKVILANQLALITSAIANGGILMRPYYVDHIETPDGTVVKSMYRMCVNRGTLFTEEAITVVSDSGEILSPK